MTTWVTIVFTVIILCGFSQQPVDEQKAQGLLPGSHHPFWQMLGKCQIQYNEKKGTFSKKFTDEIKALDGKEIEVSGFMLPLEDSRKQKTFYLSRKTPTCPFCMPGGPNEVIYVKAQSSIPFSYDPILIKGKFKLVNDEEKGIFFQLEQAVLADK